MSPHLTIGQIRPRLIRACLEKPTFDLFVESESKCSLCRDDQLITELLRSNGNTLELHLGCHDVIVRHEPELPSIVLVKNGFVELLCKLLATEGDVSWKFLQYLPHSPQIVEQVSDTLDLVLCRAASSLEKQYLIECYLKLSSSLKAYRNPDVNKLAEIFIGSAEDFPLSHLLIQVLGRFSSQIFVGRANQLLRCCLHFVINSSFKRTGIDFLAQLVREFPETTVFTDDLDLTEQLILSATDQTWPQIRQCLISVITPLPIFERVNARLDSNNIHFAELFAALLPAVGNYIDNRALFAKCIEMIQSSEKLLLPACEIAMSILNSGQFLFDSSSEIIVAILEIVFHSGKSRPPLNLFKLC
jgi:hypothetical protein